MQNTTATTLEGLWIDINIINDSNLSIQEKFTLAIIKALDKYNGCFASNKYFAQILQVTPKRASDIIQSLITKNYITSIIEDNYKRTIHVVENIEQQIEQTEEKDPLTTQQQEKTKRKSLVWKGYNLSELTEDAIERLKKRFREVEILLQGGGIDENEPSIFTANELLAKTYKEAPSEWQGVNQLQFA